MADYIFPTDAQVERAARILCEDNGVKPDDRRTEEAQWNEITGKLDYYDEETWLEYYWPDARQWLVLLLNQDIILGSRAPDPHREGAFTVCASCPPHPLMIPAGALNAFPKDAARPFVSARDRKAGSKA